MSEETKKAFTAANDSYVKSVNDSYEKLKSGISSILESYEKEVTSRASAISASMGLFDEFKKETETSGAQLLANLKTQVTGLQNWMDTLAQLEARGINGDFILALREMGPNAAGQVEQLNKLTDEQLEEYVSLWESKNDLARQSAEKELVRLQDETVNKISSLIGETEESIKGYREVYDKALKELGIAVKDHVISADEALVKTAAQTILDSAPGVGENTIDGIIAGLNNRAGALYSTISGIISQAIAAAAAAADINSPSEVMRKFIGQNLIKGAEVGILEEARSLSTAMKTAVSGSLLTAQTGFKQAAAAGGGIVNNYTFYQTNNSPKSLPRIEIYRQTRNQFRLLEEV